MKLNINDFEKKVEEMDPLEEVNNRKPQPMQRALSDDLYSDFGPNAGRSSGETSSPSAKVTKPRIVSKKELEDSGMSLRDFLNKERGLTRRKESKSSSPALIDSSNIRSGRRPEEEALLAPKPIDPSNIRSGRRPEEEALLKNRVKGMKSGGFVSSASSRADGCATKGKTKGTMITMKNGGKC
jgi:hypothetical protein